MKSGMKPEFYTSEAHYEKEKEAIFKKLWIFAGFKFSVAEHNQFFTRDIAGMPIVVQNFNGQISAFINSCAHRAAKIQTDDFGTRPLACKYHGWKYDCEGSVSSIPMEKKYYKFCDAEKKGIKLTNVHVKCVGELVFVNFAEKPIHINKQFHPAILQNLIDMSRHLDVEFMYSRKTGEYNWKLPLENLNDGLHPIFVHPKTISQMVDFEGDGYSANENVDLSAIELFHLSYTETVGEFKRTIHYPFYDYVQRFGKLDRYYNWILYPNLHIASFDGGYTFLFEHYNPHSAGKTELVSYVLTAKKTKPYSSSSALLWDTLMGSRVVIDEDEEIMELAQAGMHSSSPSITLGAYEEQNKRMETWYLNNMMERKG